MPPKRLLFTFGMFKPKKDIMATVKFYLKGVKWKEVNGKKTETVLNPNDLLPIYLQYNYNYFETDKNQEKKYLKLRYFINEKIKPKFWNFKEQRAKETKMFPEYSEFNTKIDNIEKTIKDLKRELTNNNIIPTREKLKEKLLFHFNKLSKPTKEPQQYTFIDFIEKYINESKNRKSKGTVYIYEVTLLHLNNYIENRKLKTLDFDNIDIEFYYDFLDYLKNDLNHSINTQGKHIKTIKTFLNEAYERNYHTNFAYKSKKFKTPKETPEKIYLTDAELTAIYNLDLSNNTKLDKVRDLFIIGCYTALRFSDFSRIKKENIIENGKILKFRTQKTDEVVYIPIHYRIAEILKKYDNSIPPSISNQKMNAYIKEVGKLAGIDTIIIKKETKGNLSIDKKYKKYELITTHTARRSGATNMFKSGIAPINIMKITGHRTEKAFMRYIRITPEENAKTLLNHDFFKKPLQIAK